MSDKFVQNLGGGFGKSCPECNGGFGRLSPKLTNRGGFGQFIQNLEGGFGQEVWTMSTI